MATTWMIAKKEMMKRESCVVVVKTQGDKILKSNLYKRDGDEQQKIVQYMMYYIP